MKELATGIAPKSKDNTRDASTISVSKLTQSFSICAKRIRSSSPITCIRRLPFRFFKQVDSQAFTRFWLNLLGITS